LTVADVAARLTTLGFPGDSLQVARIAAKTGGRNYVVRAKLLGLILGKRSGAPPGKGCENRLACSAKSQHTTQKLGSTKSSPSPWRPGKVWQGVDCHISATNYSKPASTRTYFSVPDKVGGFPMSRNNPDESLPKSTRETRSVSPRVDTNLENAKELRPYEQANRARSLTPRKRLDLNDSGQSSSPDRTLDLRTRNVTWGKNRETENNVSKSTTAWDNNLFLSSEVNSSRVPAARGYFTDYVDKSVKRQIQRKMADNASRSFS